MKLSDKFIKEFNNKNFDVKNFEKDIKSLCKLNCFLIYVFVINGINRISEEKELYFKGLL